MRKWMEHTKTPTKAHQPINYKVVALIFAASITYHILNSLYGNNDSYSIFDLMLDIAVPLVAVFSFIVVKRCWDSEVFRNTYLSLGLAYVMSTVGNVIWNIQESILHTDPYPSISDVFYFAYYPFAVYHLLKNGMYFKRKLEQRTKIWLCALPVIILIIYVYFSDQEGVDNFDFWYGMIFVSADGVVLAFIILGFQVFRKSILGPVWGLLLVGIMTYVVADVWYYHLAIFDLYDSTHFINMLYMLSPMIIIYALYKHLKTI